MLASPATQRGFAFDHVMSVGSIVCFLVAEAYPQRDDGSTRGFCGPLALYVAAGFTTFRELPKAVVVRKRLV